MAMNPASRAASTQAPVFEFLPALARRRFGVRLAARTTLDVLHEADGLFTFVLRRSEGPEGEVLEDRFAQMRTLDARANGYRLYWKKGNGRWTAYCGCNDDGFSGTIDECLAEIARDPFGCFWS